MLLQLLRSILGIFCGTSTKSTESEQQYQSEQQVLHYPTQSPQYHGQSITHDQWTHTPTTKPGVKIHQDANQTNQSNPHYLSLRAQANEHGGKMAKCFQESHEAYAQGNGALAKELSNQGKEHQKTMEKLNKEASDFIFIENNKDSKPGEVDLHGLYVKEAIARADQAIQQAKQQGQPQIQFIVGKGLHSQGGVAKIRPAIEELIQKHQLCAQVDPNNIGVLLCYINSQSGQRGIGADEISRRLERNEESCIVM